MTTGYPIFHKFFSLHINGVKLFPEATNIPQELEPALKFCQELYNNNSFILTKTSGSTGKPKEIQLPKKTILNSAQRTLDYFSLQEGNKVLLALPIESIAGKMMIARALLGKLDLKVVTPSLNPLKNIHEDFDFAPFSPAQVHEILETLEGKAAFERIKKVIIGGSGISPELETKLKVCKNEVYATYGMTETASHVAVRSISEEWFTPLQGIRISSNENQELIIHMDEIEIHTHDIVELNEAGQFKIQGRSDWMINTGGIKVNLLELEEKLNIPNGFVYHLSDEQFTNIIAVFSTQPMPEDFPEKLNQRIPNKKKHPKKWVLIKELKMTSTGKLDRIASSAPENLW